jgi:hypothetical protein
MLCSAAGLENQEEIPPECLHISQLCGRKCFGRCLFCLIIACVIGLPLTLNIVGSMIKRWGAGWQQDVPAVLQSDLKSLAEQDAAGGLTIQERIVASGLESITGPDAKKTHTFFRGFAVFPEDALLDPSVVNVLWSALFPAEKSQIRMRRGLTTLLDRSLWVGAIAAGVR